MFSIGVGSAGLGVPEIPALFCGLNLDDRPRREFNSKDSTTFWGRLQKTLFLATSIVWREHAWNRQWIF